MSSYSDISGMQSLREASQTVGATDFKTYVEQKAHEVQNDVADVVTGLGNEVMGHALLKTLEHVGKAKKALKDAAKKKLDDATGKVNNEVSDFADRADGAISDAQDGVRAAVRDGRAPVEDLFEGGGRASNPFGSGRIVLNDDGTARIAASTDEPAPSQPSQAQPPPAEDDLARPAPAQPAPVEDDAPAQAGDNLGSDLAKGTEDIAEKTGEKVAVKAGEDVGEQSLKGAFLSSLGEDESPLGLAATAALGIATLVAGIVSHHHAKPPVVKQNYIDSQPINYSYQSGL